MPFDMLTLAILVGFVGLLAVCLYISNAETTTIAAGFLLFSLALFPRPLWQLAVDTGTLTDMAPATPTIETYTISAALGLILVAITPRKVRIHPLHLLMLLVLLVLLLTIWSGQSHQWSGFIVVLTAVIAWAVGHGFAQALHADKDNLATAVAVVVSALLIVQLVLALLQLAGLPLPTWLTSGGRLSVSENGRAIGTLGHPANLSKVTFLLMLVLLPLTAAKSLMTKRWAGLGVTLAIIAGVLTVSRANIIAMVVTLTIWLIWSPRGIKIGQRVALLGGVIVVGAISAPSIVERFLEDPDGGARPELLVHGLEQIERQFWEGTGLNSYVEVVAPYDPMTALGFPVHNTFLFVLAEFGAVSATLFFLPLVILILRATATSLRGSSVPKTWSRAAVAAVPGFLVITTTGWGMAGSQSLVLWFFVTGLFFHQVTMEWRRRRTPSIMQSTKFPRSSGVIERVL